ncbi:restriction endonuclease subunit S [Pseudomonas sp. HOU2]|uniref:restriction endonuclease subunit S n=1 Tax=Pseudomonas sp. HOU2 TaxID=3230301 RepID=UPI0034598654
MSKSLGSFPTYENYRDSGVECYGSVPAHWKTLANKYIFDLNKNLVGKNSNRYTLLSLTLGGIIKRDMDNPEGKFPAEFDTYQEVTPGDFVFCLFDVEETPRTIGLSSLHGMITGAYTVFRPRRKFDEEYLQYLYLSLDSGKRLRFLYKGLRNTIPKDVFLAFKSLNPPIQEQKLIARFLSVKTAQIDQAIQTKERQIELLKERKQILIQQAVTRGLNPRAPMRNSDIEWIGEIPSHWSIKRAKYIFREVDERSPDGQQELLSVSHLTGVTPRSEKNVTMFMSEDYTGSKTCQKDDLIFNIMWAWMGALGVSDRAGIVSSAYGVYRQLNHGTLNPQYLEMLLKTTTYIAHYNKVSTGLHSSRLRFYGHMFMSMEIGFPNREEQDAIVAHLDLESEKLNKALDLLEQQITKLKEYKVTLINSAVTGKIKVPGVSEPETQDMEVA